MTGSLTVRNFLLQIALCCAITCPPPFTEFHGACLHVYFSNQMTTWCKAQEHCRLNGGELVRGGTYLKLNGKTTGLPQFYLVGLTDFQQERRNSIDDWQWSDGATLPQSSDLLWTDNNYVI